MEEGLNKRGREGLRIEEAFVKKKRKAFQSHQTEHQQQEVNKLDFFDGIPDDLVVSVFCNLSATADCPSDFFNALITCKRFYGLGFHPLILLKISPKAFTAKAKNWSDSAHKFLKRCVDAGNIEASYTLGMIRFYGLQNRGSGASLMAKAAISSHARALYSLAVIQFNGSGGAKNDRDLRAGVALCARAAFLGHIDALREVGHCLQDGYGVRQNVTEGRRYLVQANARELDSVRVKTPPSSNLTPWATYHRNHRNVPSSGCPLLSDYGCNVPAPEPHPASKFLGDWFELKGGVPGEGLRLCSHEGCGRPETRRHEFRRCSVCGEVNYCSRACQALDWKMRHKFKCTPVNQDGEDPYVNADGVVNANDVIVNENEEVDMADVEEEDETINVS